MAAKKNPTPKPDLTQDPSAVKDPADWVTGEEPMTGAQASYVHTLARQAGAEDELPEEMTKAEASEKIDELQAETGRGKRKPAAGKTAPR